MAGQLPARRADQRGAGSRRWPGRAARAATRGRREGQAVLEAYRRRPLDGETIERWLPAGSPEACAERIAEYVAAGANTCQFAIASYDQAGQIRALADRVLPRVPAARAGIGS
jgi:alkanesulfonate monooxygenase SsuD/methylene tetrahydromethanopterin reductase-like flavin-dependent oxidoreductase (luciferase family)